MPLSHLEHFLIQTAVQGSGVVDHVAFRSTGLSEMIAHLKREGVEFTQRMVSDQGLYQLFLMDPNGVKIELSFANSEAIEQGIVPDVKASQLSLEREKGV